MLRSPLTIMEHASKSVCKCTSSKNLTDDKQQALKKKKKTKKNIKKHPDSRPSPPPFIIRKKHPRRALFPVDTSTLRTGSWPAQRRRVWQGAPRSRKAVCPQWDYRFVPPRRVHPCEVYSMRDYPHGIYRGVPPWECIHMVPHGVWRCNPM